MKLSPSTTRMVTPRPPCVGPCTPATARARVTVSSGRRFGTHRPLFSVARAGGGRKMGALSFAIAPTAPPITFSPPLPSSPPAHPPLSSPVWPPSIAPPPMFPLPLSHVTDPTCCTCELGRSGAAAFDFVLVAAAVLAAFFAGVFYSRILRCIEACGKRRAERGRRHGIDVDVASRSQAVVGALEPVVGTPVLTPVASEEDWASARRLHSVAEEAEREAEADDDRAATLAGPPAAAMLLRASAPNADRLPVVEIELP